MDFLNLFENVNNSNNFLVVSQNNLRNIIKIKSMYERKLNKLFKFKLITTKELINFLSFDVKEELYLKNISLGYQYETLKEIVKFAKYNLENKNTLLTNFILSNDNFIYRHNDFLNNKNNFKFYILDNVLMLNPFLKFYNLKYEIIKLEKNYTPNILKFNNVRDEIIYLFNEIAKLIDSGTLEKDIYIANSNSNYNNLLIKYAKFFNINLSVKKDVKLIDIPYIKKLFSYSFTEILNYLNDLDTLNLDFNEFREFDQITFDKNINKVINIFNKYPLNKYSDKDTFNLILENVKNSNAYFKYLEGINLITLDEIITVTNKHLFIINASYESFPSLVKDSDYLNDKEKVLINYPTSEEVNKINNLYLNELIHSVRSEYISYSLSDYYLEYGPSDLVLNIYKNLNILEKDYPFTKLNIDNLNKVYSKELFKYYFSNTEFGALLTEFSGDFKVSQNERKEISKYIKGKDKKLSPSTITRYYQIPFIYYLENILGVNTFEKNTNINIGNFFHLLAEITYDLMFEEKVKRNSDYNRDPDKNKLIIKFIIDVSKKEFDLNYIFDNFLKLFIEHLIDEDSIVKLKTNFFIFKNKEVLINAVSYLINLESFSNSKELHLEKPISTNDLSGKADLVKINSDNTFTVIDYKSRKKTAFSYEKLLETIIDLINDKEIIKIDNLDLIQIVVYGYLLSLEENYELRDLAFFGYFEDDLKLNALMTEEMDRSFYVGFKSMSRMMNDEQKEVLFTKIQKLIEKTRDNILNAKFNVKVLKDIDNKRKIDKEWYGIYQALAFFNKNNEEEEDEDD